MLEKISVIVPVYNAENYIEKCIYSILNQTYEDFEIIVVNDGSSDNSLNKLLKLKDEYPDKIRVFSQENKGVSVARNFALENVNGDFIAFVDSDDWIESDYLQVLKDALAEGDVVISGFKRFNSIYEFQYEKIPENNDWAKFKYCSVAGKMYRKSFLNKYSIHYKKFKIGEDAYFNIDCYAKANKVLVAEYAGYCNYENVHSVTNNKTYSKEDSFINVLKAINNDINTDNINKKMIMFYYIKAIVLDVFLNKDSLNSKKLIEEYRKNIYWYKKVLHKNGTKFSLYWQSGETFQINFIVNVFILFSKLHLDTILLIVLKKIRVKLI